MIPLLQDNSFPALIECFSIALNELLKAEEEESASSRKKQKRETCGKATDKTHNLMDTTEDKTVKYEEVVKKLSDYAERQEASVSLPSDTILSSVNILKSVILILLPQKEKFEFGKLISKLHEFLKLVASNLKTSTLLPILSVILQAIGQVSPAVEFANLDPSFIKLIAEIIELDWLKMEHPLDEKTISVVINCLKLASSLPKGFKVEERKNSFLKCIRSLDNSAKKAAFDLLPKFLLSISQEDKSLENEFLKILLETVTKEKEDNSMLKSLFQSIGKLNCLLCSKETVSFNPMLTRRNSMFFEEDDISLDEISSSSQLLVCSLCDSQIKQKNLAFSPLSIETWSPLFKFVEEQTVDCSTKASVFDTFKRIFFHLPMEALKNSILLLESLFLFCPHSNVSARNSLSSIVLNYAKDEQIKVDIVKSLTKILEDSKNPQLKETVLICLGEIGNDSNDDVLETILGVLIKNLTEPKLIATCYYQISEIAQHKSIKIKDLFDKFGSKIYRYVVDNLKENPSIANEVAILMDMDQEEFLSSTLDFTLYSLILTESVALIELCNWLECLQSNRTC